MPGLPDLGLPQLDLPDLSSLSLPAGGLSDIELRLVGKSISSECLVTPTEVYGQADPVQASIVAVVGGNQIPIANVPPEGMTLGLDDVLTKVRGQLPAEVGGALDQITAALPTDALGAVNLLNLQVGEKVEKLGEVSVTGLGVETAYPGLVDLEIGKVTCNSNGAADQTPSAQAGSDQPKVDAGADVQQKADGASVKAGAKTPAGEGVVEADVEQASNNAPLAPIGWGALVAIMLAGLSLGAIKARKAFQRS